MICFNHPATTHSPTAELPAASPLLQSVIRVYGDHAHFQEKQLKSALSLTRKFRAGIRHSRREFLSSPTISARAPPRLVLQGISAQRTHMRRYNPNKNKAHKYPKHSSADDSPEYSFINFQIKLKTAHQPHTTTQFTELKSESHPTNQLHQVTDGSRNAGIIVTLRLSHHGFHGSASFSRRSRAADPVGSRTVLRFV